MLLRKMISQTEIVDVYECLVQQTEQAVMIEIHLQVMTLMMECVDVHEVHVRYHE